MKIKIKERTSLIGLESLKRLKKNFIFHPKILLTISRSINSMSSNKVIELNKIINSICSNFLLYKNYEKYFFFLLGIFLRISKLFLSKIYTIFRKSIIYIIFIVSVIYFTVFYTPFFWHVGNNLIYFNEQKKTEAVFVLSGHQGFNYWNNSYKERFLDIKYWVNKYDEKKDTKFYLLGKLQTIPEQKILQILVYLKIYNKQILTLYIKNIRVQFLL